MTKSKTTPEYEQKVVNVIRKIGKPCNVGFIAKELEIGFMTTKALLLEMALQGKLLQISTSQGKFFTLPEVMEQ